MDHVVARAFLVGMLDENQLTSLQEIEDKASRCMAPFEVVKMFNLDPIKDYYGIPSGTPASILGQRGHIESVNRQILRAKLLYTEGDDASGERFITDLAVTRTHSFDWNLRRAIAEGNIDMHYKGRKRKKASKDSQ